MKWSISLPTVMAFAMIFTNVYEAFAGIADNSGPRWCQPFAAKGKLEKVIHTHEGNGSKFTAYILILNKTIVIPAGECEDGADSPTKVKEIQVKEDNRVLAKFVGKTILVSGTLSIPENFYDVRNAILYPPFKISLSK